MGFSLQFAKTIGGYPVAEVVSALQKAIRRGEEEDALFWATELDLSNFGNYCWKRLQIITSEDIGLASPLLPAVIRALYDNWLDFHKENKDADKAMKLAEKKNLEPPAPPEPHQRDPGRLFLTHAVLLLVRELKSRIVDHAAVTFYKGDRAELARDIPDYVFDLHTVKGKHMKRGVDHFFEEGAKLANESTALSRDPCRDRAIAAIKRNENRDLFEK